MSLAGCAVQPVPVTQAERAERLKSDRLQMYRNQEPIAGPLTQEEAMARAVRYNLENRLRLMEEALGAGQLDAARYEMLPKLVAAAGYTARNNELVTDSRDVTTRQIVLGNTTSQDQERTTADLTFTWNALDFGVSYYQAQQQADRSLILQERRRKTVQNQIQQVRQAYWLAVGSQVLEGRVEPLLKQVNQALADARQVEQERLRPPLEVLNYRKAMLEILRQLEAIRDEMAQAKPRLAALMNLPPGTPYQLQVPMVLEVPKLGMTLEQMEERALVQRPELIEADLQERISANEVKKAMARMLPGVELSFGPHYDSNSYLHNKNWVDAGLRVTWNMFNLITGPKQKALAEQQAEIARTQRLVLNMAVLTQVHVSYREYEGRRRQYELAQQLYEIDDKIHEQTRTGAANDAQSRVNEIRAGVGALMADYRRYQNYATLQASQGQMIATLGEDPLPEKLAWNGENLIPALAKAIGERERQYTGSATR